jgi:hypothetical protein
MANGEWRMANGEWRMAKKGERLLTGVVKRWWAAKADCPRS